MENNINKAQWKQTKLEEVMSVDEYLLKVHKIAQKKIEYGIVHLMYENLNGLNSILSGNNKLEKSRQIIDDMEADVVAYCQHRQNLRHKKNEFRHMFNGGETDIRAIAEHNDNENMGRVQEGGTAMLAFGNLMNQFDGNKVGTRRIRTTALDLYEICRIRWSGNLRGVRIQPYGKQ